MNPCFSCVKYLIYTFNLLLSVASIALIGFTVYVKINQDIPMKHPMCLAGIILGCSLFVITFLGCCGSIQESMCLLALHAIVMCGICCACSYVTYYVYSEFDKLQDLVLEMRLSDIQEQESCCGIDGPDDYKLGPPMSCYNPDDGEIFDRGCHDVISEAISPLDGNILKYVQYGVIGATVLAFLCFIASLYMSCVIGCKYSRGGYHDHHTRTVVLT